MTKTKGRKPRPLRGKPLLRAVMNKILNRPDLWDQGTWHCGSSHCFAGWAQILGGRKYNHNAEECVLPRNFKCDPNFFDAHIDAQRLLELDNEDANYLFSAYRELHELYTKVCELLGEKPQFKPL